MKKKTIKLTDSSLMGIINEAIDEFRSDDFGAHGHDGDFYYTRPNGRTNIGTKLKWSDNSNTKRAKHNHRLPDGKLASVSGVEQVVYGHGKGSLCNNVMEFMQKEFQVDLFGKPTGKIEWTEKEQEAISDITTALSKLAQLTKEEGNKKRGYDGPEEMSESQLRSYIYEKVKKRLNEENDWGGVRNWAAEHGYSKADIYGDGGQEEAGEPLLYDFPEEIEDKLNNEYKKITLQPGEQTRSLTPEEERLDKLFDELYAIGEKYDQQCSWVENDAFSDFVGFIPSSLSIPADASYDNTQEVYSDVVRFFKEISPIIAEIIQDDASRIQDILVKSFKRTLDM